jgi:hypothetical protein
MAPPSPRPKTLNFITSNANKLREVIAILGGETDGVEIQSAAVDVPEIQGTVEEIARDKAARAAEKVGGPVLTEDTALEFTALRGLPGPFMYVFCIHFVGFPYMVLGGVMWEFDLRFDRFYDAFQGGRS